MPDLAFDAITGMFIQPGSFSDVLKALDLAAFEADHSEPETEREQSFPIDALPASVAELVRQIADVGQFPAQLAGMAALAVASAAIGKQYRAANGSNHGASNCNLYVLGFARTGTGKGSSNKLAHPLLDFERVLREQHQEKDEKGPEPRLSVQNATSEALARTASEAKEETVFSFSPEAGDSLRIAAGAYRKSGGDFAFLNASWCGERAEYNRTTREDIILNLPCISLLWLAQPFLFDELAQNRESVLSGFIPRCLVFSANCNLPHDDGIPRTVDIELYARWNDSIRQLLEKRTYGNNEPTDLPCTAAAREVFREFHNRTIDRRNAEYDISDLLSRARENSIRVSVVLAVLDGRTDIDEATARNAVCIVEYCIESLVEMLDGSRYEAKERDAEKLADRIKKFPGDTATLAELKKRNGIDRAQVEQLAQAFPNLFEIQELKTGGRPSTVVRLKV